jgi:hypothetical protein
MSEWPSSPNLLTIWVICIILIYSWANSTTSRMNDRVYVGCRFLKHDPEVLT